MARKQAWDDLLANTNDLYEVAEWIEPDPGRFALIERSKYDGTAYVTLHDDLDDAAVYHDTQEEPHDWPIEKVVDLDTGKEYKGLTEVTYSTTFSEVA